MVKPNARLSRSIFNDLSPTIDKSNQNPRKCKCVAVHRSRSCSRRKTNFLAGGEVHSCAESDSRRRVNRKVFPFFRSR